MTETVGTIVFTKTHAGEHHTVAAAHVDPVITISVDLLHEIMTGGDPRTRVLDNKLILELANGTWTYQLGEYNPIYRGIMARLIEGEPMAGEPVSAGQLLVAQFSRYVLGQE